LAIFTPNLDQTYDDNIFNQSKVFFSEIFQQQQRYVVEDNKDGMKGDERM